MPNMSYCKFQNTIIALRDCYYNINDKLSDEEHAARKILVCICKDIIEEFCNEENDDTEVVEED